MKATILFALVCFSAQGQLYVKNTTTPRFTVIYNCDLDSPVVVSSLDDETVNYLFFEDTNDLRYLNDEKILSNSETLLFENISLDNLRFWFSQPFLSRLSKNLIFERIDSTPVPNDMLENDCVEKISFSFYDDNVVKSFKNFRAVKEIRITRGEHVDCNALINFPSLEKCYLLNSRIANLSSMERMPSLMVLSICGSNVMDGSKLSEKTAFQVFCKDG